MKTDLVRTFIICAGLALAPVQAAPSVHSELAEGFAEEPFAVLPAVVAFDDAVDAGRLDALLQLGITGGIVLDELDMVLVKINLTQFRALSQREDVLSLYGLEVFEPMTNASRPFIGLNDMTGDRELLQLNGGLPISGRDIGVAYIDTGIDATHPDLQLGRSVIQNVYFPLGELQTGATGVSVELPPTFLPSIAVEDQPNTDLAGGHGTFGAGIVAGSGEGSANFYGGVAPGAKLIGLMAGNDLGLSTFSILQAYNYALANQYRYNIRIANNSFGANIGDPANYDPNSPINIATRKLHDRYIAVVFAAGNSGDSPGAINRLSVAPWVISVAAGDKQGRGTPAGFSSRGENNGNGSDIAGQPADPHVAPNLRPDLIAPGTDIKSARAVSAGATNTAGTAVGNDLQTIPPAFLPRFTTSQGTSFAAPHVSGVIALMLEVNPALTPDEIVTLLRATATPMPGFEERTVGAGFLDVHNAVRAAAGLASVSHPASLAHAPGVIEDPEGDNSGTSAHDILAGRIAYDGRQRKFFFELTVRDMAPAVSNHRWTLAFVVRGVTVFTSAERTPTEDRFTWGTIERDPATGINNQTNRGEVDSGDISSNSIRMELAGTSVSEALGHELIEKEASGINATSWTLIGSPLTGGLLLAADTAGAAPFVIRETDERDSDEPPEEQPVCENGIKERLPGQLDAGTAHAEVDVLLRCTSVAAHLVFHPGNVPLGYELRAADGTVVTRGEGANGRKLSAIGLEPGEYTYLITGDGSHDIDFVIRSVQE